MERHTCGLYAVELVDKQIINLCGAHVYLMGKKVSEISYPDYSFIDNTTMIPECVALLK